LLADGNTTKQQIKCFMLRAAWRTSFTRVRIFKHSLCLKRCSHRVVRIKKREETTSVKHVFFKKLPSVTFFQTYSASRNNKTLIIWLGTVGTQFENTAVISTVKTESYDKKPSLRLLFFTLLRYFKCSLGSGYSFSPTCRMCI